MAEKGKAYKVLTMNTLAFTICFAVWMVNGVLVTYLVDRGVFHWDKAEIGLLIGIPVLTGAVMRLPVGILTDKYGGRIVFTLVMIVSAIPMYFLSIATEFWHFVVASLGFGLSGASFAVGIAYTSVWFKKEKQGTALGIFGAGNAGAALTSLGAPWLLKSLTNGGMNLEAWRTLPVVYAIVLVVTAVVFYFTTHTKIVEQEKGMTLRQRLAPLKYLRVWRFGLYYFVVFGGFVALAQWLIPYYVNAYTMTVASAGFMASIFSLPSGVIRALGGWLSDKYGGRQVMYWVFGTCLLCFVFLCVPRMEIQSPGQGIMAEKSGVVESVSDDEIIVAGKSYVLLNEEDLSKSKEPNVLVFPSFSFRQDPVVKVGDDVQKKELLARGSTHIFFQANVWIFTALVFIIGIMMGIGKAGVYKFIPEYYPKEVGVVGGIVGVLGGLGGFFLPIIFGNLLKNTGIWTTAWMFLFAVTLVCHLWMHSTVRRMMRAKAPNLSRKIEDSQHAETPVFGGTNA